MEAGEGAGAVLNGVGEGWGDWDSVALWGGPGARATHLLEKQWAADTTQQVWMRLPAQKLLPM